MTHLGKQQCCRTLFALRGHGKALRHSGAACMCGYDHDSRGHMWMSTGSRGSTHPKHHPLHTGNTKGYFDEGYYRTQNENVSF